MNRNVISGLLKFIVLISLVLAVITCKKDETKTIIGWIKLKVSNYSDATLISFKIPVVTESLIIKNLHSDFNHEGIIFMKFKGLSPLRKV